MCWLRVIGFHEYGRAIEAQLVFEGSHPERFVGRGENGNNEPGLADANPGIGIAPHALFGLLSGVLPVGRLRFGKRAKNLF